MQTGVAGMKAFFFRQVEGASDVTKTNEQTVSFKSQRCTLYSFLLVQIKEEAARRKALREAKQKMNDAIMNADKVKSAEEVAKEMKVQAEKQALSEAEALKKKDEDEKAARAARKAALNAKWSGSGLSAALAAKAGAPEPPTK